MNLSLSGEPCMHKKYKNLAIKIIEIIMLDTHNDL